MYAVFVTRARIFIATDPNGLYKEHVVSRFARTGSKNHPLLNHPLWLVVGSTSRSQCQAALQRDFVQADILDRGPDNRQATALRGEDVDLISALAHITE